MIDSSGKPDLGYPDLRTLDTLQVMLYVPPAAPRSGIHLW
jgi:hypothetical protein